jgi:leucyl-tRNA synthetase
VLLLSPIVPHIAESLWSELRTGSKLRDQAFPKADPTALVQDEIELVIQVNGKLRGNLTVAKTADKAELERLALAHPAVEKQLAGAAPKKIVVVPGRLINVVM